MASWLSLSRSLGSGSRPAGMITTKNLRRGGVISGVNSGTSSSSSAQIQGDGGSVQSGVINDPPVSVSGQLLAQQAAEKRAHDQELASNYAAEESDLLSEEQAAKNTARQAVTARMDSEARRIADMQEDRARRGIFAGDGSVAKGGSSRSVKVSGSLGALEELRNKNFIEAKRKALKNKYAAALNPSAALTALSRTPRTINPRTVTR